MNKFLTIATVAAGLLFATAVPSEARDRHRHSDHRKHYSKHHHHKHHHHKHYSSHRHHRHYRPYYSDRYYYGRPVYRHRHYNDYYYPRRSVSIFVPGIGYVIRSY